jgi:hypothetical protein
MCKEERKEERERTRKNPSQSQGRFITTKKILGGDSLVSFAAEPPGGLELI